MAENEQINVEVTAENAPAQKAAGYLLSFDISEGEHEIELSYTVPGIKEGAVISLFSLLVFVSFAIYKRKKQF